MHTVIIGISMFADIFKENALVTRYITRISAVLAAILIIAALVAFQLPVLTVSAADTPVFTLESSVSSAKTGDIVTISLYVDNATASALSSFDGDITFNSSHFSYIDFSYPDSTKTKLTCLDYNAASSSKINITYADTTKSLIPAGTTHFLLLQLRFSVISPVAGSGQLICSINNCYSGLASYGSISPAQLYLSVSPTQATTTSSTAPTTMTGQRSSDAQLRALSIAPGTLTPAFSPDFVAYTVSVEYEVASIRISATPSSNEAVATGVGIKDLAVGQNTFTVTVTAEDGSTMRYGIVVIRAAESETTVSSQTETTTSTTYDDSTELSTVTGYPEPSESSTLPTVSQPDKVIEGGTTAPSDTELLKIIGIIFAEVALFMFGFLAGFFLDKNMKKKAAAERAYGSLERQQHSAAPYIPPQERQPDYDDYQPEYHPEYQEYNDFNDSYQQSFDTYPQYNGYDSQRFDEYGNPILDNAPYDDGFWDYGDNHNDPYYH